MIEQMAKRSGFGAVLADGTRKAAERIGRGSEQYAIQVHGSELPMHNPRQFPGTGHIVAYSCDPTPARHVQSRGITNIENARDLGPYQEFRGSKAGMDDFQPRSTSTGGATPGSISWKPAAVLIRDEHGDPADRGRGAGRHRMGLQREELLLTGERIQALRQLFISGRASARTTSDCPSASSNRRRPAREEKRYRIDDIRRTYFQAMNWDPETGEPSPKRLRELGLEDLL